MANWKKVIVSGSAAHLLNVTASNLTDNNLVIAGPDGALENSGLTLVGTSLNLGSSQVTATGFSGSFSGSFQGDGSQLTGVIATSANSLTNATGGGIAPFSYNGLTAQTVAVSGAADLNNNAITKWDDTDNKFANSSLTDNGTTITGGSSIQLTGASSNLSGSFSGSFFGNGSGLTGLASTLTVDGDTGTEDVNLITDDLQVIGTANEVETAVTKVGTDVKVTIGLPSNVTIGNNLTVSNNLTVFGTASFQNTENLLVADRFVLLASGSNAYGDGGIVIQQDTQNVGELFGWDDGQKRWAVTGSFVANQSAFTPDAFMAAAINLTAPDPNTTSPDARYNKKGNIYVSTANEDIWIYS
jgi:hypothetical protein